MQSSTPLCLFTGQVEKQNGEYVLTIPDQEIDLGTLESDETYRVGIYPSEQDTDSARSVTQESPGRQAANSQATHNGEQSAQRRPTADAAPGAAQSTSPDSQPDQPPVSEGEILEVEIEGMGEKGDGLAKVGPGYVVFVADTEVGQQPLVRVTTARENFAFAEVVEQ
jgi:predicted RNA-binding protein with TRAM domain